MTRFSRIWGVCCRYCKCSHIKIKFLHTNNGWKWFSQRPYPSFSRFLLKVISFMKQKLIP